MKKWFSLIGLLSCILILSMLCGCGNNAEKEDNQPTLNIGSSTTVSSADSTIKEDNIIQNKYSIITGTDFNDGFAWVYLRDKTEYAEGKSLDDLYKTACINQKGEIQFMLNTDYNESAQNHIWGIGTGGNRYDYFMNWHKNTCCLRAGVLVDKKDRIYDINGNVIFEVEEPYLHVLCYADGYYAISKNVTSIDKNDFYVCFMDTDGKWLDKEWKLDIDHEAYLSVEYLGEGIFYNGGDEHYYNINSDTTFEADIPTGWEGIPVSHCGCFYNGRILSDFAGHYHVMNNTGGEVLDFKERYLFTVGLYGRYSAIYNGNTLMSYDSKTDEIQTVVTYDNGIEIEKLSDIHGVYNDRIINYRSQVFIDDKIVVKLNGVDGKTYFTTFTFDGKQLYDPIMYDTFIDQPSCDRIIVTKDEKYFVYDYNGKLIFTLDESLYKNISDISSYSNDIALIRYSGNNSIYLTKEGEKLFDKLSKDGASFEIVEN